MVFNCKGFYFDEEDEAFRKNSAEKRAEKLPADKKSKQPRGNKAKRVVPVVNANTEWRNQMRYGGTDDQSKKTSKAIDDDRDIKIPVNNLSSRSKEKEKVETTKLEEKLWQPNAENSELSSPQLVVNYGNDFMEPHKKMENSGHQKTQKEYSSPLLLRIRMHCNCDGCVKRMKKIFQKSKAGGSVKIHRDKDLVEVTGTKDTNKLVTYLEENLRRTVEVMPMQNYENGASSTQKQEAGVRHIANITDNASKKKEAHPDMQKLEKQNPEKTELTFPQPTRRDGNYNEVTGMVHLKIGMHCVEGCIAKTRKTLMKFTGVESVEVNESKDLVIVVGAINVKKLVAYLKEKLKRSVEVVLASKDNVTGENREEGVTNIETLKELTHTHEDGRNKDVEIKKEAKKEAKKIKIEEIGKDAKVEDKKCSLHGGGYDGTKEDKEDKNGNEGVEDKVKNAKEHGYVSHVGEKHKELEREGEYYYENYGRQDFPRDGISNCYNVPVYRDGEILIFSDENPNACAIM